MSIPRFSLIERLTYAQRRTDRKGLALLDVLVGMAVFGIIAAAAVVALGQFRQSAFQNNAISDAQSIALKIEGDGAATNGVIPHEVTGAPAGVPTIMQTNADVMLDPDGAGTAPAAKIADLSAGNRFRYVYVDPTATTPAGFIICITHYDNGSSTGTAGTPDASVLYRSLEGGIVAKSDSDGTACNGVTFP